MAEHSEVKRVNGYEKTYEAVAPRLRGLDFPYAAKRLGFDLIDKHAMSIDFLGRKYELSRDGVRPVDGEKANVNILSVLAYYALSEGGADPRCMELCGILPGGIQQRYDFALLSAFAGGLVSGGGDSGWMTEPLRRACGGDCEKFSRAARDLGMFSEGSRVAGEHAWLCRLLPKIPALIKCFEADDEFPFDIKIYYDKTVSEYLDFEPLAVLNGCLVSALTTAVERR